jgi:hypothetical protein
MLKSFNKGIHLFKEDVLSLIECSIENTVREMLPLQNILQLYIGESMRDEEEQPEDHDDDVEDEDLDELNNETEEEPESDTPPDLPDPPQESELNAQDLNSDENTTKSIETGGFFSKPGTPKASPVVSPPASPRGGPTQGFGSDLED